MEIEEQWSVVSGQWLSERFLMGLKPEFLLTLSGTAKAVPFQKPSPL